MLWLRLNVPLALVFVGAWSRIRLWMVFKYPDWVWYPHVAIATSSSTAAGARIRSQFGASVVRQGNLR